MRRFFWFLAALLVAAMLLAACGSPSTSPPPNGLDPVVSGLEPQPNGAQLALIGTEERLADGFGQGVWSAISKFAGEAGLTSASYKTTAEDPDTILSTLDLAVKGDARLIVSVDAAVSRTVKGMAWKYPDVDFILLDAPNAVVSSLRGNTVLVDYSAAQSGWLAGYVALYEHPEGLRLVENTSRLSQEYALGFLLGAQAAAEEKRLEPGSVQVTRLTLERTPDEDELAQQLEALFAEEGGPVFIAGNGDAVQQAAVDAARKAGGTVIGVGLDPGASGAILAGITYDAKNLVADLLAAWSNGNFPGGKLYTGEVAGGSVLLNTTPFRFANVSETAVQRAAEKFADGSLARRLAQQLAPDEHGDLPTAEALEEAQELDCLRLAPPEPPLPENGQPGEAPPEGGQEPESTLSVPPIPTTHDPEDTDGGGDTGDEGSEGA